MGGGAHAAGAATPSISHDSFPLPRVQSGKTSRGAMKRFFVSGDGTIYRAFAGRRHLLNKQTREQLNEKGHWTEIHPTDKERAERLLGRR